MPETYALKWRKLIYPCDDQRCSERKRRPNSPVERNKETSKLGRGLHNKIDQYPRRCPNDEIAGK